MSPADEIRMLRERVADLESQVKESYRGHSETTRDVVVVPFEETTYPGTNLKCFACRVNDLSGVEAEGQDVVLTPQTQTLYVFNIGPDVPPTGRGRIASNLGNGFWVMEYRGP